MSLKTDPSRTDLMTDAEVLARTLWGEARGQGEAGMEAVACVIMNRARHPRWWGRDVRSVCLAPYQFSCWNKDDPNRAKLLAVTLDDTTLFKATEIAERAIDGELDDATNGADHYCTRAVAPKTAWTKGKTPVAEHGAHLFYRLELPPPKAPDAPAMKPLAKSRTVRTGAGGLVAGGLVAALPEVAQHLGEAKVLVDQASDLLGPDVSRGWLVAGILAAVVIAMLALRVQDKRKADAGGVA